MKYLIIGVIAYFILKRVLNIGSAVNKDSQQSAPPVDKDKHGGEYVDYEELD